jgi:hypothetical protein
MQIRHILIKDYKEISIFSNSSHLEWRAGLSDTILKGTHPGSIPVRFGLIWFSSFREDLKFCPVIPTLNQDGHQAKNRKKGNEILIVHCCFSISQNELKFLLQLHGKE